MPDWPVDTYREAAPLLRRPFSPEAVRWKIQTQYPKGNGVIEPDGKWVDAGKQGATYSKEAKPVDPKSAMVVAYIDARLVIERLNLIIPEWSDRYELAQLGGPSDNAKHLVCHLTVGDITRPDIGKGSGPEALKAAYSDSLKRAAVKFGVGVSIYAIPIMKIDCQAPDYGRVPEGVLPVRGPKGKRTARIEASQLTFLADRYEAWLATDKGQGFGEPIDHGDAFGAAGEEAHVEPADGEQSEALFEDPQPAKDPKQAGKKITAKRAGEIGDLFQQSTRDHLELAAKLEQLGCPPDLSPTDAVKGLKGGQADDLEQWLKTGAE